MSVTPSKIVTDKQKSSTKVQAVREQLPAAAESLVERFPAPARIPAKAGLILLGGLMLDWLRAKTEAMVAADAANAAEAGDDQAVRVARDAPSEELHTAVVDLRDILIAVFGEPVLQAFGLEGTTPTDPVVVHRIAVAVLATLHHFTPPPVRRASLKFDAKEWIATLEKPAAQLGKALVGVAEDDRQNQLTLSEKNRAIEAYDLAFKATATFFVGLFTAAGRPELADKVRPSTRRAGQTEEDAPAAPPGANATGAEEKVA